MSNDPRHPQTIAADQAAWEKYMGGASPADEVARYGGQCGAYTVACNLRHDIFEATGDMLTNDALDSMIRTLRYEGGAA